MDAPSLVVILLQAILKAYRNPEREIVHKLLKPWDISWTCSQVGHLTTRRQTCFTTWLWWYENTFLLPTLSLSFFGFWSAGRCILEVPSSMSLLQWPFLTNVSPEWRAVRTNLSMISSFCLIILLRLVTKRNANVMASFVAL